MGRRIIGIMTGMVLLLMIAGSGYACDFCMLSQGISPLDTMKSSGIKITERYTLLDRVYEGTDGKENPGAKEDHWTTELTGFYGITPEFMVLAVMPYKKGTTNGEMDLTTSPAGLDTAGAGSANGLGDVALMGRYTFLKQEKPDTTDVMAGLLGIKFATGGTSAKTADGAEYLDSHMQPGTGSTDYLLGLSYSHALTRFSLAANLLATISTEGKFGNTRHQFGNALNYDVTGKYRILPHAYSPLSPQFFVAMGIAGEAREREKIEGEIAPDTGGNVIYLSPGVQLVLVPHWSIDLSFQQAILHNLYGTQLGETYKAVWGAAYLF